MCVSWSYVVCCLQLAPTDVNIGESHQKALDEARQYVRKFSVVILGDKDKEKDKDKDKDQDEKDLQREQVDTVDHLILASARYNMCVCYIACITWWQWVKFALDF